MWELVGRQILQTSMCAKFPIRDGVFSNIKLSKLLNIPSDNDFSIWSVLKKDWL